MRFERFFIGLTLVLAVCLAAMPMFGQSLTTGNITGTVLDPSHAVVPGAKVTLKSIDNGSSTTVESNATGGFSFGLLRPGRYEVSVKVAGFAEVQQGAEVEVGQTLRVDVNLFVAKGTETVEVSDTAPLINTEPSTNTTFTAQQVAQLPSAGGDITNIADTAPGAVVNGTGGYGNFTVNGMPATSNLFTVNGENDMDPYFNINNSGASNLTLGQNEVSEATVITNPYGGQYGQLAGAQVTYVTKSGTNTFHGNAAYWWNGRYLNANDWMSNNSDSPRAFSNANQWATSIGGPILKNKVFFFFDYEGMRFLLPNVDQIFAPTPAFISAAEANIAATQPAESSASFHRFRLTLEPQKTTALVVKEFRPVTNHYELTNVTDTDIKYFLDQRMINPDVERALRKVVAQKNEIAGLDATITGRKTQITSISEDQQRVRENMKALKGSAEEKALVERYVKELNEQEDRMQSLRHEITDLQGKRESAQKTLNETIEALQMEVTL